MDYRHQPDPASLDCGDNAACEFTPLRPRGVAWVVRWAAALGVLVSSAALIAQFAYCLAAEQALARAARAGVLEATLPRANSHTVQQVIWRRLDRYAIPRADARIWLMQNGVAIRQTAPFTAGDRIGVTLSVRSQAVLPAWLHIVYPWNRDAQITVHAERRLPGPTLGPAPKTG